MRRKLLYLILLAGVLGCADPVAPARDSGVPLPFERERTPGCLLYSGGPIDQPRTGPLGTHCIRNLTAKLTA